MKYLLSLLLVVLISCGPTETERAYEGGMIGRRDKIIQSCIDRGGIPILSSWDGRLTGCIFPPKEKP
jgi:hypothetical protein